MCGNSRTYLSTAQGDPLSTLTCQKPSPGTARSCRRWTSKASMASKKLVRPPRQTPLQTPPYCAPAVAQPSDATGTPDRDQRDHLCPPTRAGGAALRGRTIIGQLRRSPATTAGDTGSQAPGLRFFPTSKGPTYNPEVNHGKHFHNSPA